MQVELIDFTEAGATLVLGGWRVTLSAEELSKLEFACSVYSQERSFMLNGRADMTEADLRNHLDANFADIFGGVQ
jgi:hypothetical protein